MVNVKSLVLLLATACALAAAPISGSLWLVPDAVAQNAVFSNIPATAPDATFQVNSPINFNANSATVNAFLMSGGAFNIVGTPAVLGNAVSASIIEFTGQVTVTNGQVFSVQHDDGLTLEIGGMTVVNAPGPTAPVVTNATYTGPSGTFDFRLVYAECCGGPAVLRVDLPFEPSNNVPEPATVALTGAGLLFAGIAARRRKS